MPVTAQEILEWSGGRVVNSASISAPLSGILVERPAPLGVSRPSELAFFFNKAYEKEAVTARAGVLITAEPFVRPLEASGLPIWKSSVIITCADPYLAMAILSGKFAERISTVAHVPGRRGPNRIHPTALVDSGATLGTGVEVGPNCVIEKGARIGSGTTLYAGCWIGPEATLGEDCVLFPGVTVYEWTEVGSRVRIHAGAVLGSDGFGYAPVRQGKQVTSHQKIFHLGRVVVGDDVEIGANTCLDRGTFGETRVEKGSKLDNQVHIGHNARLDEGAIVCGGTCLAGRASVGRFAYVGGLTGVANDVHIGDGASVGALTLVTKDVPAGGTAVGVPQRDYREHFKAHAALNRLVADRRRGRKKEET